MKDFKETDQFARLAEEMFRQYELFRKQEYTENERALLEQRTVLYKFYCGIVYGHLYRDGICLRCNKKQKIK